MNVLAVGAPYDVLAQANQGAGVPIRELLLVCLTAAVVTFLATGGVRVLANKFGAVAAPRERDVHVVPTPRLGGTGMYLGMLVALLFASQLPALTRGFGYTQDIPAALVAGFVIVGVGVIDDRWGLDALTKFVGQVTAAGVLVVMGVSWYIIYVPWSDGGFTVVLDQLQAGLVTVLVTVVMVNAMNFVDGLDGLAAGLGLIASVAICIFSVGLLNEQGGDVGVYPPAVIAAALAGACLGFLPHNFQPARIFMGDSGSMLIGLMLATVSTSASGRIPLTAYGPRDLVGLLTPLLLVGAVDERLPGLALDDRSLPSPRGAGDLSVGRGVGLRCRWILADRSENCCPARGSGSGIRTGGDCRTDRPNRPGTRAKTYKEQQSTRPSVLTNGCAG